MGRIECGRPPCSGSRLRTRSFSPTGMPVTRSFRYRLSRRQALAGIAASMVWRLGFSDTVLVRAPAESDGGPVFYSGGPDAELYGAAEGFPILDRSLSFQPLNPTKPKYRVGAFSHLDAIFKTREIARAAAPWHFKRSPLDIQYSYGGTSSSLADYLARNPVTGLLIAKDDQILFEHYQYGRTDRDRMASQSMAKSIVGVLIGVRYPKAPSDRSMTPRSIMCRDSRARNTAERRSVISYGKSVANT